MGPIRIRHDTKSGILHIVLKKHFDQFWEFHFEALEANGGQNALETSGEVGLSWEWSRKIPGEILTYLDTKKVKIRPF